MNLESSESPTYSYPSEAFRQNARSVPTVSLVSILGFIGFIAGAAAGITWNVFAPIVYQSDATFIVMNSDTAEKNVRHDILILSQANVLASFTERNLFNLESFDELPREESVAHLIKNSDCIFEKDDPRVLHLSTRMGDSYDAKTLVEALLSQYETHISESGQGRIEIVHPANVGEQVSPVLGRLLALGAVSGLMLGGFLGLCFGFLMNHS